MVRGRGNALRNEMLEKGADVAHAKLSGMSPSVVANETADPGGVAMLGRQTVVTRSSFGAQAPEERGRKPSLEGGRRRRLSVYRRTPAEGPI